LVVCCDFASYNAVVGSDRHVAEWFVVNEFVLVGVFVSLIVVESLMF